MSIDLIPAAVATVAALCDLRWRVIPNWLTLTAIPAGVVLHVLRSGPDGVATALGGAMLGLCLLFPFYLARAIGAGDVKLLAAIGALVGVQTLMSVAIYGALAGGIMSIVLLVQRGWLLRCLGEIATRPFALTRSGAKAPYGIAIASGVYLSMLLPNVIG